MQKLYAIICSVFCFNIANTQNLVPNPGFDSLSFCGGQIIYAPPWLSINTADVFNACQPIPIYDVPTNYIGSQNARSPNGYAGIVTYVYNDSLTLREYLQVELISPLEPNLKYCVEFYVSLSDSCYYAIDAIGAVLADTLQTNVGLDNIFLTPQISNINGVLNDKLNWTKIEGSFVAQGGEKYLTIGNFTFQSFLIIDTIPNTTTNLFSYYYIDDVAVYLCDSTASNNSSLIIPNVFSPNGDDVNDLWMPQATGMETMEVTIINRWGEIVHSWTGDKGYWDGYTFPAGVACNEGTYFYWIKAKGYDAVEYNEKGTITLLK